MALRRSTEQRDTARIPDAMIRCGQHPRVLFEVVSPSELRHKRQWDQKRADLQAVEGVLEIVEIYQDEMLAHAYRRQDAGWVFESIAGPEAQMALPSVGIAIPLAALYERVPLEGSDARDASAEGQSRRGRSARLLEFLRKHSLPLWRGFGSDQDGRCGARLFDDDRPAARD